MNGALAAGIRLGPPPAHALSVAFQGGLAGTLAGRVDPVLSPAERYRQDARSLAPGAPTLTCVEISHPEADAPIRLVDDGEDLVVGGVTYSAARFEARTTGDGGSSAPRGQIAVGNVGREVSRWIDEAGGGGGGSARVFDVLVYDDTATVEWELTMDIASIAVEENVSLGLGFDPLLGRPAVAMRYDPQTAPGLV